MEDFYQPFNRRAEVLIGPFPEDVIYNEYDTPVGLKPKQKPVLQVMSDGTQETLRVKFQVHKNSLSTASPTLIHIYNLSPERRGSLKNNFAGLSVELRVGWDNRELVTIFLGTILNVISQREGADIITTIYALAAQEGQAKAWIAETFGQGTSIITILQRIVETISGVSFDILNVQIGSTKTAGDIDLSVGSQGLTFAGSSVDWLNKLARVYGFDWWIDSGKFFAVDSTKVLGGGKNQVLLSGANGFLIKAEPILFAPAQKQYGVRITSLLNPYINIKEMVTVESVSNSSTNGSFEVHTLYHVGDTGSSQWETHIESLDQTLIQQS